MSKEADWIAIEGDFRAGTRSYRELAAQYSVSVAAIQRKAKKNGWVRDPTGTKRRIVAARLAGVIQEAGQCTAYQIEAEADQDVQDMQLGLQGARLALQRAVADLQPPTEEQTSADPRTGLLAPKDLKILSECVRVNIETLRMIRGLDDPKNPNNEEVDAEIERELAKLHASQEARTAQAVARAERVEAASGPADDGLPLAG
jgi:hypothetical protein